MEVQQLVPLKSQPQFIELRNIILSLFPGNVYVPEDTLNMNVRKELFDIAKALFNNNRRAVMRLAKEYFVDEVHATYFMEYVYKFRKALSSLIFAPNYLGIVLHATQSRRGREVRRIRRYYVIGINDYADGLFINEMDTLPPISFDVKEYGNIMISESTDENFRSYFGYDEDVLQQDAVLGVASKYTNTRYRVSGEIVFWLWNINDYYITSLFKEQVERYIAYLIADKLARVLIDHGFNIGLVRFSGNDVVIHLSGALSGKLTTWRSGDSDEVKVVKALAKIIGKYFTIEALSEDNKRITISDDTATVDVDFVFDTRRWGERRADLELWITLSETIRTSVTERTYEDIMRDIIDTVNDMLNNSERTDELIMGNHYIKIERGLPINLTYEPRVKTKMLDPMLLTAYRPRTFLVTPRTKITIQHPQHGTRNISFDNTYALNIITTNISEEYPEKVNVIVLRKLLGEVR
jgi:hypothetical protein